MNTKIFTTRSILIFVVALILMVLKSRDWRLCNQEDNNGDFNGQVVGSIEKLILAPNVEMEFIYCPPGTAMLGSEPDEAIRFYDEPLHRVVIDEGFWIARTEVTQKQFKSIVTDYLQEVDDEDIPAAPIDPGAMMSFFATVNEGALKGSRWMMTIPTTDQWEYACRSGDPRPYHGGALSKVAWHTENSLNVRHPVGQKEPNAWGAYDMLGNIAEMCEQSSDAKLVCRGGNFRSVFYNCRAAVQVPYLPKSGISHRNLPLTGFRPIIVLKK